VHSHLLLDAVCLGLGRLQLGEEVDDFLLIPSDEITDGFAVHN